MNIVPTKNNLATVYFWKIRELETAINQERKKLKEIESTLKDAERRNKELEQENEKLRDENEQLKECRKTYAKMLFKAKTSQKTGIKRDGKQGHHGVSRKKPDEAVIEAEIEITQTHCQKCHQALGGCKRVRERIIEDIVLEPRLKVKRYWIHEYECRHCGEKQQAKTSAIIGQSPFGKKIFAVALYYRYRMNSPLAKIAGALEELHGIDISISGIQNLLCQASLQFGKKHELLIQHLKDGKFIHGDETGWRVNGENWWTWLWSNDEVTVYQTENTRGRGIAEKALEGFKGLLYRDGYNGYNIVKTEQQLCWVHLLRKAHEYCGWENASREMLLLKSSLKDIYGRMQRWHGKKHSAEERLLYHQKMQQLLNDLWKKRSWKAKDARIFLREWLQRHENRVVTFLKYDYGKAENNTAERDLRPKVVFRKITGGSKSAKGAKTTDINMSIIASWKKQNISVVKQIANFGFCP